MKRFEKLKRVCADRRGFSMAEMLITVLIMSLVSVVMATGVPAAANAYSKVVDSANAQLLLSTTMTLLRDELGTATNVRVESATEGEGDDAVIFPVVRYTASNGGYSRIALKPDGIYIREYMNYKNPLEERLLVSREAANEHLYMTAALDGYQNGVITFRDLEVHHSRGVIAEIPSFRIRVLSDL